MDRCISPQLNIRKRSLSEWLILFLFLFPLVQAMLTEFLGIPDIIKFLVDGCLMLLLAKIIIQRQLNLDRKIIPFVVLAIGLVIYSLVVYLLKYQSIFYYIWGLRNNFRFHLAFVVFALMVEWDDAKKWLKLLDWLYVLNIFVILFQYFDGHAQDYLGGIFGVQKGCNGSLLAFMAIVVCKSVLLFMRGEESTFKCISVTVSSLLIAALAELKFFFIIFIIIVLLAAAMTKHSVQKTLFLFFGFFCTIAFSTLLSLLYEEFGEFLSFDNLWKALTNPNYATDEDVGRLTAIPVITDSFMSGVGEVLFGLGLGNCDASSISLFNTPFYDLYYSYHYAYFSYAMLYLETGIVGLVGYASFFIASFVFALRSYIKRTSESIACQMAMIMSVMCCILLVYNVSLRSEISYLIFFVLALPLISGYEGRSVPYADRSGG